MEKIKVGLFGFGKTGKLVAQELINHAGIELSWVIKRELIPGSEFASRVLGMSIDEGKIVAQSELNLDFFVDNHVDVIVDFSDSAGVYNYKDAAISRGIKVVSAISKYQPDDLEALHSISQSSAVVYSPNITLGVNILMVAAKTFQSIIPEADIEIIEEHFRGKAEISGTAKRIANYLEIDEADSIKSIRAGGIVGKHEIIFGLPNQTLRVTHESISRASFGQGAIFACQWIHNRDLGMYTMEEIMIELFRANVPENSNQNLQLKQGWFDVISKKLSSYFNVGMQDWGSF